MRVFTLPRWNENSYARKHSSPEFCFYFKLGDFENRIHLSKLSKINIDKKSDIINENISLNEEIRNALYNELVKKTKISTNDQMINAVVDSY